MKVMYVILFLSFSPFLWISRINVLNYNYAHT